jgi:hypothetical protein
MGNEVDRWASALRVAVEDVESATAELASGTNVVGIVLLSVVVAVVVVLVVIGYMLDSAIDQCGANLGGSSLRAGVHLTSRPFDRDRGCYVGDPLAVADPWPAPTAEASALGDPAPSHALVR